ncbi:MAG TPA: pitrilysin family protein [Mycobacteriales bacterium]|nr:pitrilysin family protein [Mycobacteriales bacterium]
MSAPALQRPVVGVTRTAKLPPSAERTFANGLRVVAVRKPGVPVVELRVRLPLAATGGKSATAHTARLTVLAETILRGTERRTALQIAEELQRVGGALGAGSDADRFALGGSALSSGLPVLLDVLADVLQHATYPQREVEGERDRLLQDLAIARTQPGLLAAAALARRVYGTHPYAFELAHVEAVQAVTRAQVRALHASRIGPQDGLVVIVGDLTPAKMLDAAEKALGGWTSDAKADRELPPMPEIVPGAIEIANRPGAVQTNIRFAGASVPRDDPSYPALLLAHTVFGGYFSSRLVANIREDKGFTYSPRSSLDHARAGSTFSVVADVATGVTAPALAETLHELLRITTAKVGADELDAARRYSIGSLALRSATQAGLATTLAGLLPSGLGLEWLREQPRRLGSVTVDDVLAAAQQIMAPSKLVTVLLGDADAIAGPVGVIAPVEVTSIADL